MKCLRGPGVVVVVEYEAVLQLEGSVGPHDRRVAAVPAGSDKLSGL